MMLRQVQSSAIKKVKRSNNYVFKDAHKNLAPIVSYCA